MTRSASSEALRPAVRADASSAANAPHRIRPEHRRRGLFLCFTGIIGPFQTPFWAGASVRSEVGLHLTPRLESAKAAAMSWVVWAVLSAIFAGVTAILAKVGVENVNSHLATAIRTTVVLVLSWAIALAAAPAGELVVP